jgi:hypothetical protein
LYHKDGNPDILSRRVLGLILWTVEFRESELRQQKELTEATQRETTALLVKAEHLAKALEAEIERVDERNETRLRTVLNCLLDSRLRLERAIVRFTNRKIASAGEPSKPAAQAEKVATKKRSFGSGLFRWLVISIVLTSVTGATLYFVNQQFDGVLTSSSGFSNVDVRALPQHEFMRSAYRHDQTLIINAHDSWKSLPENDRSQTLLAVLNDPKYARVQTVVVMGENGEILENKSRAALTSDRGAADAVTAKTNQ